MSPHHDDPLGPEERELAERLARLGATTEPSAALDARILDAARGRRATMTTVANAHRPRWHAGLGVAASLALALGVAWQLRPLPDASRQPPAMAPVAAQAGADAKAIGNVDVRATTDVELEEQVAASADADEPPAPAAGGRETVGSPATERAGARAERTDPASLAAGEDVQEPAREAALPATSAQQAGNVSGTAKAAAEPASPRASAAARADEAGPERRLRPVPAPDARAGDAARAAEEPFDPFHDEAFDEDPPASADSPEVRRAWLARIRELVVEGRTEAARASLREFRRRYPLAQLPEDLQPLAD